MAQLCSVAFLVSSYSKGEYHAGNMEAVRKWPALRCIPSYERKVVDARTSMQHRNANMAAEFQMKTLLHRCDFPAMIRMAFVFMDFENLAAAYRMVC